jgi:hypothetical protein
MNTHPTLTLDPSTVAMRLGMCAAALAGVAAAPEANAAVVTFSTPITIPANTAGIYINLLTGGTATLGSAIAGWDFNPYLANAGANLGFYWNPTPATPRAAGVIAAGAPVTGPYLSLAPGSVISAASNFTSAINATVASAYLTSGTNTLGLRFFNETAGITNYGFMSITTAVGTGFPARINGWSFETNGGAITVPGGAVPEPSSLMLSVGALALGASQLRKVRRQRRQQAH